MNNEFVTLLVHAESKTGKTWLGDTTPAPRLILDAESGGLRFTPSRKVMWDPLRNAPPEPDGSWDTCVVSARSTQVLQSTYQWLNTGEHPFLSVTVDSVMEIQKRIKKEIAGGGPDFDQQDWGKLLFAVEETIRDFRDLTEHPTHPLRAVIYICGTKLRDGMYRPFLQGQVAESLPYLIDGVGFLSVQVDEQGTLRRYLVLEPGHGAAAGNRFGGRLPGIIWDPTVEGILNQLYGKEN